MTPHANETHKAPWARIVAGKWFAWSLICLLPAAIAFPLPGSAQQGAWWENEAPSFSNDCSGTLDLRLNFENVFRDSAPLPMMAIQQRKPVQRDTEYIGRDPGTGEYKNRVDKPCDKSRFLAILNRVPVLTEQNITPSKRTIVCLSARPVSPTGKDFTAHLRCQEGTTCIPDIGTDMVDVCKEKHFQQGRSDFGLRLVPVAFDPNSATEKPGWGVPSLKILQTFLNEEQAGYTHFRLENRNSLSPATHAFFGVFVNDTPIYIDSQSHFEVPVQIDPEGRLSLEFALPTLVFSGPFSGEETIAINLRIFSGTERVANYRLRRTYAALRDAEPLTVFPINSDSKRAFLWTGDYIQPVVKGKFEIFIFSSKNKDDVLKQRSALNTYGTELDGRPIVGVIRPPLGRNPYYGLVMGLVRETGQVQFTFNDATSQRLCKLALDMRRQPRGRTVIDKDVNRYEMEPRAPGTPRYRFCRDLVPSDRL